MAMDAGDTAVLEQVREGMTVVDVDGDEVGTVSFVQLADQQAAEIEEPRTVEQESGLFDVLDVGRDDDVTERMLQRGYVKIDAAGLFGGDKYVLSDDVAGVEGDVVRLRVDKDAIEHPA